MARIHEVPGYTPSPTEVAFDKVLNMLFRTSLKTPYIDDAVPQAVRVAEPRYFLTSIVAFQHRRLSPIEGDSAQVARALLPLNRSLATSLRRPHGDPTEYHDRVVQILKERAEREKHGLDPVHALTDPGYFTEGNPVGQWPEVFEAVVLEVPGITRAATDFSKPTEISPYGSYNGRRADTYVRLSIPTDFRDDRRGDIIGQATLSVYHPRDLYTLTRAEVMAFEEFDDLRAHKMELLDKGYGMEMPTRERAFYMLPDHSNAEAAMARFGNLVMALADSRS